MESTTHYRTIWISDLHLGTPQAKADFLLDFLRHHEAERYYLVGDIFDGWALQRSWYWPTTHNEVIQGLLRTAQNTHVTYVPGNHDEASRDYTGLQLGGISIEQHTEHVTADGRRFLIVHGDEFEGVVRHARWVEFLGEWTYSGVLTADHWFNELRRLFNLPYWSLANHLKHSTQQIIEFIEKFEEAAARKARDDDFDGVICGHIHHPRMRSIDGTKYVNTGDWTESCTALVEHQTGQLEILRWIPRGQDVPDTVASEVPYRQDGHDLAEMLSVEVQSS